MRFSLIIAGLIAAIVGLYVVVARRPAGNGQATTPVVTPAASDRSPVVATVDGTVIRLRQLEDELLRREGREALEELVRQQVKLIDWSGLLRDEAVVVAMPGLRLTRGDLLKSLADQQRRMVSEMIEIEAAEQVLRRDGIVVDQPLVDAELRRMRSRLSRRVGDHTQIDLETMVRQEKSMGLDEFMKDRGFRTLVVGVRALAEKHLATRASDDELRKVFAANRARYHLPDAVDLSVIHIPYRPAEEAGVPGTLNAQTSKDLERAERARLSQVFDLLHGQLKADPKRFGMLWRNYARSYEKDADEEGRIGWVRRDGSRDTPGARTLDRNVMSIAFACAGPFPQMLPPISHDKGIDLLMVHGRRVAQDPEFAAVQAKVRADWIEERLDPTVKQLRTLIAQNSHAVAQSDGSLRIGTATISANRIAAEVLGRHGAAEAQRQVSERLIALDWAGLGDDTVLADMGAWSVRRGQLAAMLLADKGAQVREDLINFVALDRGFVKLGVVIDRAAQDAAIAVLEHQYRASAESAKISFRDYVRQTQGASVEEFMRQPAFRLLAGLHILVERAARAEFDEDRLKETFAQRAELFNVSAAVDLAVVFLPLARQAGKDGRLLPVADSARSALAERIRVLHDELRSGKRTLAQVWLEHGRQFDAYEAPGGRLGWVDRAGKRETGRTSAPVPKAVVECAFSAKGPFPMLLPPLIEDAGATLIEVQARRDDHRPSFAEARERVLRELMMSTYEQRGERVRADLRRQVEVDYGTIGLMEIVDERRKTLGGTRKAP